MAIDAHANFGVSSVAVAPSPAMSGTSLTVATGEGTRFPAVPFNATLAPAGVLATPANAEIVRVTARSGDVLTIARAHEGTAPRAVIVGDLCVASITAKALQDIETGFARLDVANTFTESQHIQTLNPRLYFWDTSQAVNQRQWDVLVNAQKLRFRATDDADTTALAWMYLTRAGNLELFGDIFEKQRTTPMGHLQDVPFNASNFSGAGGTWTVPSGTQTISYSLVGKTVTFNIWINGSTTTGTISQLAFASPLTATRASAGTCRIYTGTLEAGITFISSGSNSITFARPNLTAWPASIAEITATITYFIN